MSTLNDLIKRDLTKYYYVVCEENDNRIHLKFAGNYFERRKDVILYFDDIYAYNNTINKEDLLKGEFEIVYYLLGNKNRISFCAVLDKNKKQDFNKNMDCHFEIRHYNINNEMKLIKKVDFFQSNENIIYLLSSIIEEYV